MGDNVEEIGRVNDPGAQTNKIAISDIPGYGEMEDRNKKLFSNNECIVAKVGYGFNKLFEESGSAYKIKPLKHQLDSSEKIYELENLHLYYFIGFDVKFNYMIIASRLDSYDNSYKTGEIVAEQTGGNSPEDNEYLDRVTSFMEELNIGPENLGEALSLQAIEDNKVDVTVKNAAKKALGTNTPGAPYISYTKYNLTEGRIPSETINKYKDLADVDLETSSFRHYFFKATFKGVYIPNENEKTESYFYFEKTITSRSVKPVKGTSKNIYAGEPIIIESDVPANQSGMGGGSGARKGGINRKLKRKELNTMTLNELKQLHRNNGIKMNSNKTVNALIDNYIKNYE